MSFVQGSAASQSEGHCNSDCLLGPDVPTEANPAYNSAVPDAQLPSVGQVFDEEEASVDTPDSHFNESVGRHREVGGLSLSSTEDTQVTNRSDCCQKSAGDSGREQAADPARRSPTTHKPAYDAIGHRLASWADQWAFEIINCVLALCCLVSIVVILTIHRNRPLPQWPLNISINSLVSVFTAIIKASLLVPVEQCISQLKWLWFRKPRALSDMEEFDNASRGPWGSFLFLVQGRKSLLASFGAVITICALAIDPFSQQILQYDMCIETQIGGVAAIPRTNNYTTGGLLTRPGFAELEPGMTAAITLGTMDAPVNEAATIQFQCQTGNCTFPSDNQAVFSTLGMCSACRDISDRIKTNVSAEYPPVYFITNFHNETGSVGLISPNTSLPYTMFWPKKNMSFVREYDELFTFDALMLNVGPDCDVMQSATCPKFPWAVECSWYPCVKTYAAEINNNQLSETVLSSIPLRKTNFSAIEVTSSPNLSWSLATDQVLRNGTWQQCQVSERPNAQTPVAISRNRTLQLDPNAATSWYEDDCVWELGYLPALALNQYLSWMLNDSTLQSTDDDTVATTGSGMLKTLYRNGSADLVSVTEYVKNVEDTITARMRQSGDTAPSGYAFGSVMEPQTCIRVQWPWLALPSIMVLVSIAFLGLTTRSSLTTNTWRGAWRSSPLAAYFHGLDTCRLPKIADRQSEMLDEAKQLKVQLDETTGTLQIIDVGGTNTSHAGGAANRTA